MTGLNEDYTLVWHDHASNFSYSFSDLLEQKEMVDVTLVADGHLFNVHRLVLSALSPYFRQMFTSMPANQQAFVFMKDASKQTIQDLITFIYCGEVKVKQESLEDLFNIGKQLHIKGLINDSIQPFGSDQTSTPNNNRSQFQSTQTMRVQSQSVNSRFHQQPSIDTQSQNYFEAEIYNEIDQGDNNINDIPMDLKYDPENNQWNNEDYDNQFDGGDEKPVETNAPKRKRSKPSSKDTTTEYNIVADIQKNERGNDSLFHNGYKFSKNGNGMIRQRWECSRQSRAKCRAIASTMEINGVIMLKIVQPDHSHQP